MDNKNETMLAKEKQNLMKEAFKEWILRALSKDEEAVTILTKWKEARDKALRKNLMLDAARKKLFQYLDALRIWYIPLKGAILKELYPRQEMRQMADNDIFRWC